MPSKEWEIKNTVMDPPGVTPETGDPPMISTPTTALTMEGLGDLDQVDPPDQAGVLHGGAVVDFGVDPLIALCEGVPQGVDLDLPQV